MPRETRAILEKQYRQLAVQANRQLRELERLSHQEHYHNVKNFAYRKAMRDVKAWGGERKRSFRASDVPRTKAQIKAKIKDIQTFLQSPTSSASGIRQIYEERGSELNARLGLTGDNQISWDTWAQFWESDMYKTMKGYFEGSATLVNVISQFVRQKDDLLDAVETGDFSEISVEPDMLQEAVDEFLSDNGVEFVNMFFQE